MRFAFVEEHCRHLLVNRLCEIMNVNPCGFRAWRRRSASRRQRTDMVLLAHIREQFCLSLGRYGRPRMSEDVKALGFDVGYRLIGRLMRQNSITVKRSKKFKGKADQKTIRGIVFPAARTATTASTLRRTF